MDLSVPLLPGAVSIIYYTKKDGFQSNRSLFCHHCRQNVFVQSPFSSIVEWITPADTSQTPTAVTPSQSARVYTPEVNVIRMHEHCVAAYELAVLKAMAGKFTPEPRHARLLESNQNFIKWVLSHHQPLLEMAQRYTVQDAIQYHPAIIRTPFNNASFLIQVELMSTVTGEPCPVRELDLWTSGIKEDWFTYHFVIELHVRLLSEDDHVTYESWCKRVKQIAVNVLSERRSRLSLKLHSMPSVQPTGRVYRLVGVYREDSQIAHHIWNVYNSETGSLCWKDFYVPPTGATKLAQALLQTKTTVAALQEDIAHRILGQFEAHSSYHVTLLKPPKLYAWASATLNNHDKEMGICINAQRLRERDVHYTWTARKELLLYEGAAEGWWPIHLSEGVNDLQEEIQLSQDQSLQPFTPLYLETLC